VSRMSDPSLRSRMGQPLPAGKFPGDLLASFLKALSIEDPSILMEARAGEDMAAVDISGEHTLILTSDPITDILHMGS